MIAVSPELWERWKATAPLTGGVIITSGPHRSAIQGQQTTSGSNALIEEYLDAAGITIARKVEALNAVMCWLRVDLIPPTENH